MRYTLANELTKKECKKGCVRDDNYIPDKIKALNYIFRNLVINPDPGM